MKRPTFNQYAMCYAFGAFLTFQWTAADPCPGRTWIERKQGLACGKRANAFFEGMMTGVFWPTYWVHKGFMILRSETPDAK